MELLKGTVSKLRFSTETQSNKYGSSTLHIALFEVDGKVCELRTPMSIVMTEGDSVLLAGELEEGMFEVLAYRNLTTNIKGVCQSGSKLLPAIAIFALAFMGMPLLGRDMEWVAYGVMGIAVLMGVFDLLRMKKVTSAVTMLDEKNSEVSE